MLFKNIKQYISKHVLLLFASVILISLGYSLNNNNLILYGDILFLMAILIGKPGDDIISYAFIIPFTGIMPVGFFRIFYCLLISIIKLAHVPRSNNNLLLLSSVYFGLNYFFFDYLMGGNNSLLTLFSFMLYIIFFTVKSHIINVDIEKLALLLVISCMLILRLILVNSDGLDVYADSINIQHKFGEDSRDIGGAMGVSLYTSVGFSVSLIFFLIKRGLFRIFAVIAMIIFSFFAIYALSRTFFLSLTLAVFTSLLIALIRGNIYDIIRYIKLFLCFFLLVIFTIPFLSEYLGYDIFVMIEKLESLFDSGPGSRLKIWSSVFQYLLTDPLTLIFGAGTNRYSVMTETTNYAFHGYGAHNLYFDILLSFGILGFIIFLKLYKKIYKTAKYYNQSSDIVSKRIVPFNLMILPLLIFAFSQLTQGSFRDTATYIYPIVLIIITFGLQKNK